MGLIIGNQKAALIDTGLGWADLRKFVSQFADLPIIVLNTHSGPDHEGANQLFDMSDISQVDGKAMLALLFLDVLWKLQNQRFELLSQG